MARTTINGAEEEGRRVPESMLDAAAAPWLDAPKRRIAQARQDGKLAHAVLIHGTEGVGQSALAAWAAQLLLCQSPGQEPCGRCSSCLLYLAGNHPDFYRVQVEEDASWIKIDQIRQLCDNLGLRSYRGGFKASIIDPAHRMNTNSNNALLKTLEEPPENTILLLVASRTDSLPATVVSRCQRVHVRTPAAGTARSWLASRSSVADWDTFLAMAGGAPLKALEYSESGVGALAGDMAAALRDGCRAGIDPVGLAESWFKDRPAERLAWLEYWLESMIRQRYRSSDVVNNNRDNALPSMTGEMNIRSAFLLLDRLREARSLLEGSLNTQIMFEDLLVGLGELIG